MNSKFSIVLNLACIVWFIYRLITAKASAFGVVLYIAAIGILAASSYMQYKRIKDSSK